MKNDSVLCISNDASCPLVRTRRATRGPELDMVHAFLDSSVAYSSLLGDGEEFILFLEPEIDSGFPDIVLVKFDSSRLGQWAPLRNTLDISDLKLLADVSVHKPSRCETISSRTGFSRADIDVSLELLASCGLVEKRGESWKAASRSDFFAIERIVSIEAKIGDVRAAARQALLNRRFSSESYILLDSSSLQKSSLSLCRSYGIGAIVAAGAAIQLPAPHVDVPINHVTLQFNEWVCNILSGKAAE